MRPKGDVEAAKGRTPLLLLALLLEMRGSGVGCCCCLSSRGDDAEREQEGSGVVEDAALANMFETPPLAAESRLPEDDEAAACLSRA